MALPGPRQVVRISKDALRSQVWPLPTIGVVLAVLAGVLLPQLDKEVGGSIPDGLKDYLFGGGAEAARSVLNAIASSQITVTSLTFSLTVVTLQLASSQFSPRLLRTFSRDRFVHVTLAMFLATFTYALTVLRTVRTSTDGQDVFVPQISVTFAFLLVLASVIGLVLFLAHLAREIRVETMLKKVHSDASGTLRDLLPPRGETRAPGEGLPTPPIDAWPLLAPSSGFLTSVDDQRLMETAVKNGVVVWLDHQPGGSLIRGTPMGAFWPCDGAEAASDPDERSRLHDAIAAAVQTGFERTPVQDVAFGLRQLTDVASKALSPGINDPTTAVHALDHSSALLCELIGRELGSRVMKDDDDRARVVLRRPDLADLLELALSQPRSYGAADPLVLGRIASLLSEVGWTVTEPHERRVVAEQLTRLMATVAVQDFDHVERARITNMVDVAHLALSRQWAPVDAFGRSHEHERTPGLQQTSS